MKMPDAWESAESSESPSNQEGGLAFWQESCLISLLDRHNISTNI